MNKTCPFCGEKPEIHDFRGTMGVYARCEKPLCAGANYVPIERWNTRAETPETTAIKNALSRMSEKCAQLHRNPCDEMSRCHGEGIAIAVGILRDCLEQQGIQFDG